MAPTTGPGAGLPILTLGDIKFGMSHPVADVLITERDRSDMIIGLILRNAATLFFNDNRNFAFVINFSDSGGRISNAFADVKLRENVGTATCWAGPQPVFVFRISIWKIHTNANNFLGVRRVVHEFRPV